jgi:hypothetical protein
MNEMNVLLQDYISKTNDALKNAPKGLIRLQSSKGYPRFYYYKDKSDTRGKYLSADNIGLISSIYQRDYYCKLLLKLQTLQKKLHRNIEFDLYPELDEVYYSFSSVKQELITPIIPDINTFIEQWYQEHPGGKNPIPNSSKLTTNRGEIVRSKSEKIIADRLHALRIPYVYESTIFLGDEMKSPDYLVLNKRTRQTFVWEHLGLCDVPEYAQKNMLKIYQYELNDYLVGESLILSFESNDYPLDSKDIDRKIQSFLF